MTIDPDGTALNAAGGVIRNVLLGYHLARASERARAGRIGEAMVGWCDAARWNGICLQEIADDYRVDRRPS